VGPKAALEGCGKSRPTGIRSPDLPVRSESLYFRAAVITTVPLSVNYAPGENLTTRRIVFRNVPESPEDVIIARS